MIVYVEVTIINVIKIRNSTMVSEIFQSINNESDSLAPVILVIGENESARKWSGNENPFFTPQLFLLLISAVEKSTISCKNRHYEVFNEKFSFSLVQVVDEVFSPFLAPIHPIVMDEWGVEWKSDKNERNPPRFVLVVEKCE